MSLPDREKPAVEGKPTMVLAEADVAKLHEALQKLQHQNERLAKYQELSFKWHQQHHQNLKKIIGGINRLAEVLRDPSFRSAALYIEAEEGMVDAVRANRDVVTPGRSRSSSTPVFAPQPMMASSFHERIMQYANSAHSSELRELLTTITLEEFNELREPSVLLILPIIIEWLHETYNQSLALVYLWEAVHKFPNIFSLPENRGLLRRACAALDMIDSSDSFSVSELDQLRKFLTQSIALIHSPQGWGL